MKAFKEKVASKFRSGSKTEDSQFKELQSAYEKSKKGLEKIGARVTSFMDAAQNLLKVQKKLAEEMLAQVDDSHPQSAMLKNNTTCVDQMISEKSKLEDEVRRLFLDPLNKYKQQYREMDERIRERNRRCDEMDKLRDSIKRYQKDKDPRLGGAERRLETAKTAYEDLNKELIEELPKLSYDKAVFFEPLTAVLADLQFNFYQVMSAKLGELIANIAHIDRTRTTTHPRVILPRERSAISKTYSIINEPSSQVVPHGYQQQPSNVIPPPNPTHSNPTYPSYNQPLPQPGYSAPLPTPPPQPSAIRARALWDFESNDPNELPFRQGDVITILTQQGNWWKGEMNGRVGMIPSNYVQLI